MQAVWDYEHDGIMSNDIFDEWEFCASDFTTSDGKYIRVKEKEFNVTFFCLECVPLENGSLAFLIRKIFTQTFSFINVQLFKSLLLRRKCCSFSNGEYVKAGLAEPEHWCSSATEEVQHGMN